MANKKAKEPTIKEQFYQSIANAQVQQAMQNNGMAQFQAEYNNWKANQEVANSDGYKAFQDEYTNWANNQAKTQTASTPQKTTKKKYEPVKFMTAEERKAYKEKTTVKKPGSYDESKSYANTFGKQLEKEEETTPGVKQIPKLNDYLAQMEANRTEEKKSVDMNEVKTQLEEAEAKQKANKDYIEKAKYYLDPNKKLTKEEAKEARLLVAEGLLEFEGRNYKDLTDDEKKMYNAVEDLRLKSSGLNSFAVGTADKTINTLLTLGKIGALSIPGAGNPILDKLNDWSDSYEESSAPARELAQNTAPVATIKDVPYLGDVDVDPYDLGGMASQAAAYMITNPAFDKIGKAANLGKAGTFALNQAGQFGQDLLLDTSQVVDKALADGVISEQEANEIKLNMASNAVFNLGLGLGGEAIGSVGKKIAQTDAANKAFAKNVSEGAEKLAKLNETGYQAPAKLQADEIASLNQNPLELNNKQFTDLMAQYNAEFKDTSAMRDIYNPEDLDTALNKQLAEALENNPKSALPEVETPKIPETENIIPEIAENTQKADLNPRKKMVDLSEDVSEKIASDLMQIRDSSEVMGRVAEATGNAKALEKYNKLVDAIESYEKALYYSDDLAEVNAAKKATDAARQAFIREMKKIDPNFKGELTGTKIGNAEYRRTSINAAEEESKALADSIAEADKELNTNQFVKDAEPDTQINTKGKRPYAENQGVSPSVENEAKALAKQMETESTPREINADNLKVKEINTKKGTRYSVVEEKGNWTNPVDTGKKFYKTKEEAQAVIDGYKKTPGANPLQTFADGTPKEKWATSKARTNTFENQGWGADMPQKDFAYRVYSEAEQNADAIARNQSYQDLIYKNSFDEVDVKAAMNEIQSQLDSGNVSNANRLARKLAYEGREHGRGVQAFAEYNRNTAVGALEDAARVQEEDIINPWKSKNKKKAEGNSRIAKALSDMGHKPESKIAQPLTHDQIKKGVIAELEREVGSVEKYFNDSDIEFLTQLAEDKSIPVWQITSEIEHKLNYGNWYTLDESLPLKQPTNQKLQNALNSLVTEQVRAEKPSPSLKQITEEVRNTLAKESADFEGTFNDNDVEYLANLINNGATREELADALNMKMATGSWGISDAILEEVNNIFKEISQFDPNSKQFVEGQAEAYRLLANELVPNATPLEKFEAWRYIAMLGNPKTMLRNFVGNQTFGAVTGLSNNIAAVAEAGIDKGLKAVGGEGIQRTKAVLNPVADNGLIKACAEDADASRYRQIVGSKYEKMDKNALRQSKSVFNSKLAQLYEKVTDAGISDYKAVKNKYSTSLAGYLKANGYGTDIFKAEDQLARLKNLSETNVLSSAERAEMDRLSKEVANLDKARDYALKQAEYATFHEDNKIASVLSKWSKSSREEGTGIGSVLIEGMIPFKKTPANVLRSGLEYSPLGAVDSIRRTGKLIYENTGKNAGNLADTYQAKKLFGNGTKEIQKELAADVIDSWSKTLTGTGLTALGFYLYNKGILHSSDPDTKYQDQLEGHQNYAIEINGKSYTIDWAAPTIMPLMVGAELAKIWDSTGETDENLYNNIDAYVEAANRISDPIVETSMLSGIKDTVETAANYAKSNEAVNIIPLLGYNITTGYATQGIPTIAGQVARTVDNTRRSTYTNKEGVAGVLDRQLRKQANKIPGLTTLNEPYVDTYGREQTNSPFNNPVGNLAYQMLSPGYLANINETDADRMSREAYGISNNANTLPKWQSSFKDAEGNKVTPEQYTIASKAYGEANYNIRQELANDEWFNNLDDAQKEEVVKQINTIAEHTGKAAIDPEYTTSSKPYNAYAEGGIPSLKDYLKEETDKSIAKGLLGDSGVRTNSNAGKAVVEAVASGNMEEAERLANQAASDKAAGKTTTSSSSSTSSTDSVEKERKAQFKADFGDNGSRVYKQYETAKSIDPNTSAATYRSTYKKIDSLGDSNGSVNQTEFLQYLQNGNYSEAEAQKLAKMYGGWTKIPKLENGTWKFKKAK